MNEPRHLLKAFLVVGFGAEIDDVSRQTGHTTYNKIGIKLQSKESLNKIKRHSCKRSFLVTAPRPNYKAEPLVAIQFYRGEGGSFGHIPSQ